MMEPKLYIDTCTMPACSLQCSPLPNLIGGIMLQNHLVFELDEDDELYEGYGALPSSFPYTQQDHYDRVLKDTRIRIIVLENEYLKAVFLPDYGGRLWSLTEKQSGRNLLYTNDVLRYSNLAVRNAWFSGGVEWNMGIIGHSPFTCEPQYCATLTAPEGWPILRIYNYERIRGIHWQIDFWLRPDSRMLNCRMRAANDSPEVVPMYWWSNIAVPEFPGGQVVVPADRAYIFSMDEKQQGHVRRGNIPVVNGKNICKYNNIENQTDYFFDLPNDAPKFIANIDAAGFGLLHLSTDRLKSRKLFSWGSNSGSDNWQKFLTKDAGRYIEIQAGLGKTQYGCIPMAPHTAWEWLEQYGPIRLEPSSDWQQLRAQATELARAQLKSEKLEECLAATRAWAKTPGSILRIGSMYSAFDRLLRPQDKPRALSGHLDFGPCTGPMKSWASFMETGILHCPDPMLPPDAYFCEKEVFQRLRDTISRNTYNWYAHYHLGILYYINGAYPESEAHLLKSMELAPNPWAAHGLACCYYRMDRMAESASYMEQGCLMCTDQLSYQKEGLRLLLSAKDGKAVLRVLSHLPETLRADKRLLFYRAKAYALLDLPQKALDILNAEGGLMPDDIREGEDDLERLWSELTLQLGGSGTLPPKLHFSAL